MVANGSVATMVADEQQQAGSGRFKNIQRWIVEEATEDGPHTTLPSKNISGMDVQRGVF
jgi:hypothetical protein